LSEGLASTSVAGNPREWLNPLEEQAHRARWRMEHSSDLSYAKYLELARKASTTKNGISGIKLHYYQLADLPRKVADIEGLAGLTPSRVMPRLFPNAKHVWLTRRDKVRQAISFLLAAGRDEWWSIEGLASKVPEDVGPDFDPNRIARTEEVLKANDATWQAYFDENNITPLVIQYEDLASNYVDTVRTVLRWLGIPNAEAIAVSPSRLRRQSNARNEEWVARYEEFRSQRHTHPSDGRALEAPAENPQAEIARRAFQRVPNQWKQWIGQEKLLDVEEGTIIDVLTSNGYSQASAMEAVENAKVDPYLAGGKRTQRHFQKSASMLNALGQVARLSSRAATIQRRSGVSRAEFRDDYYAANQPVILTGLMAGWRATAAWTPEYLKMAVGDLVVEVMGGRDADPKYERNGRRHRSKMRFADYIDLVYSGKVTNDYCLAPNNGFLQRPEAAPLLEDFIPFPEYLKPTSEGRQSYLWFGPAGTVTPLHYERSNVLMAQVAGRKKFRLIPSTQADFVYNREGVYSDVDCENPDASLYPKFRNATIIDVTVEPGEVLFVPVGWWHHVRALDVSMTISFTNFVFPNFFNWGQ